MTLRRTNHLLFAAALSLWAGCASHKLSMRPEPRSFTPLDYSEVYQRWTRDRDAFAFQRFEDILHVTATFESWEFRWAYVVRYARDFSLDLDNRTAMLRTSLQDAREHHRFFVTLADKRFRDSDLTAEPAVWRVLLVDAQGRQTPPLELDKVKVGPLERAYFPSVSPFRQAFRIVFPTRRADGTLTIPKGSRYVVLRFTGPAGTVDLRWNFTDN